MATDKKTFPLKLLPNFSRAIDWYVFHTGATSKHQYILDAINEKMERDAARLSEKGIRYEEVIGN